VIARREAIGLQVEMGTLSQATDKNKLQQALEKAVELARDEEAAEERRFKKNQVTANNVIVHLPLEAEAPAVPTSVKVGMGNW
jgi:hypothetical protein